MEKEYIINPVKIFFSYAHQDKSLQVELDRHLTALKEEGRIVVWHNREIQAGQVWEQEIDAHINTADIIFLLISPAFMASDYAYGLEVQRALERHDSGEARVVPILLRPASWAGAPFGKLQAIPTNGKPISTWHNLDQAFSTVIQAIQDIVITLLPRKVEGYFREKSTQDHVGANDGNQDSIQNKNVQILLQEKVDTGNFDVFLCHNNRDKPAIRRIGERLKTVGILPWLDEWELRPGLPWQPALEAQIEHIKTAAVFVGNDGIGPWQEQEINAFLREFVNRSCPVIPVLLEYAPSEPKLPIFLKGITWVDFRKREPDPWKQLLWGITGVKN
jgi:hypothetical protein